MFPSTILLLDRLFKNLRIVFMTNVSKECFSTTQLKGKPIIEDITAVRNQG